MLGCDERSHSPCDRDDELYVVVVVNCCQSGKLQRPQATSHGGQVGQPYGIVNASSGGLHLAGLG